MTKEELKKTTTEETQEDTQEETNTNELTEKQKQALERHADDLERAKAKKPGLWKRFTNSKPIRFVRKHKKEIALGAGAALLAGGAYYLGRDQGRKEAPNDYMITGGEDVTPSLGVETEETEEEVYNNETEPEETTEVTEE